MNRGLDVLVPGVISVAEFPGATGRGVRVAVIDSGVHAAHPHVGVAIDPGVSIGPDGRIGADVVDRLGHGTAVTAAIREKAPEVGIVPVKVFDRELRATAEALVAAIDWSVAQGVTLVNLSLGTANPAHRRRLGEALVRAARAGVPVVAAAEHDGTEWLPGSLPLAVGVSLDWSCPREEAWVAVEMEGAVRRVRVRASGYPRPIPGVPPDRNLRGISFAVANTSGLLSLVLSGPGPLRKP
jgi:subtilisin family serine protease